MNNMNNESKMFFTYELDEAGNPRFTKVGIAHEDGSFSSEDFDAERHMPMLSQFLADKGIEGDDLLGEAERRGVFARFNEEEFDRDALMNFLGIDAEENLGVPTGTDDNDADNDETDNNLDNDDDEYGDDPVTPDPTDVSDELDDDDEYDNFKTKNDHKVAKRIGASVLAAGAVAGGLALFHSCSQEEVEEEKQTVEENLDDLYKNMTEEQRAFFEPTFTAVENFNARTTEDGTFKLDEDKSTLHITVDEAIALNIILNDYSADELYSVFGTLEFDTTNLMNLARSAYSKLSTYYMNATKASGLSALINDETAREFFERHENAVIEFNNNPSTDLSDQVIKGLYYDYVYGGSTGEYAKINNDGVAWFATSAGFGFELANRNVEEFLRINNVSEEEIQKYQEAAATVGMSLNQITTSELLTGINEEIDIDVIDEINSKSLCAAVTAQTRDKVDALQMKQQIATTIIATNARETLVEGLKKIGANSLANKVMVSDINITPELLDEISAHNKDGNQLVEDYHGLMNSINDKEAKLMAILEIAKEKYNVKSEVDIPDLVNNRFRELEKAKDEVIVEQGADGIPVVDGEDYQEMTPENKEEFVQENGVVIGQTTTVVEEEVKEEDLTPEEKVEVKSQEAILTEIETLKNELITKGVNDAVTYTDEVGAYNYSGKIVIPYNGQEVDASNMSLFNIVAYASAFGDGATNINSSDAQVQERMSSDVARVTSEIDSLSSEAKQYLENQYGSDWRSQFINESYKDGYTKQIDGSLSEARAMGDQLRQTAEEEYNKAQAEVDRLNKEKAETEMPTTPEPVQPEATTPTEPTQPEDPNLDPNYGMEDEQPYIPSTTIDEPLHYISDEEWEAAYGTVVSENGTVKVK